jgi:hypothetical protein
MSLSKILYGDLKEVGTISNRYLSIWLTRGLFMIHLGPNLLLLKNRNHNYERT